MSSSSISGNAQAHALESILGASQIVSDPAALAACAIDTVSPSIAAKPSTAEEAAEVVRFAVKEKLVLIPSGNRTKLAIGSQPERYDIALDMTGVHQIANYDPADLTVSIDAGMPLAELNATLLEHKQFIPLLVPYYLSSTVGGAIACGLDSPLRQFYGTARDFLLGAEFIDGTGALVKSGGRVVKNVAGYDLHKLLIGSLGTLAVITRLNFRTFPSVIDGSRGFLASFATHEDALALRRKIIESQLSPLTLDVLNPTAARIFATRTPLSSKSPGSAAEDPSAPHASLPVPGEWFHSDKWQVCAAFTGTTEVLDRYARDLNRFAEESRATATLILDDTTRPSIWGRLREALPLFRESSPAATILRLNTLPGQHAQAINVLEAVARSAQVPLAIVARATGTLYVAILPDVVSADDQAQASPNQVQLEKLVLLAQEVFALRSGYGEASLLFGPSSLTKHLALPAPPPSAKALAGRLKSAFDPGNIFATRPH